MGKGNKASESAAPRLVKTAEGSQACLRPQGEESKGPTLESETKAAKGSQGCLRPQRGKEEWGKQEEQGPKCDLGSKAAEAPKAAEGCLRPQGWARARETRPLRLIEAPRWLKALKAGWGPRGWGEQGHWVWWGFKVAKCCQRLPRLPEALGVRGTREQGPWGWLRLQGCQRLLKAPKAAWGTRGQVGVRWQREQGSKAAEDSQGCLRSQGA